MHARSAEVDLFDLCSESASLAEAIAQALSRAQWSTHAGEIEREIERARAPIRRLRDGDWQPLERHLGELGRIYARAGMAVSAWYAVATAALDAIAAVAIARHAGDPARLTAVIQALNHHVYRALSALTDGYYLVKEQREREVILRHTRLIEAAADAVIEIDDRGIVTEFTPASERMFGYAKAQAVGRSLAELIVPERLRNRHRAGLARYFETGQSTLIGARVELTAMRADGSELPVELALVAAERLDGVRCVIGLLRDLRERTQTEESLAVRAHALEQAQFGIVVSDPVTRRITNVNPAYARMVGYSVAELVGSAGEFLIAAASQDATAEAARTLEERGYHTYHLTLRRKDGTTVPVLASSSAVQTRSGTTVRISTVIDMSEHAQLEQARAQAQRELERSNTRLEILSRASHEFSSAAGDVDALQALVSRRIAEAIGEGCLVRLLSDDGRWVEPSSHVYHPDPALREFARSVVAVERQRVGDGMVGQVAASGIAILIPVIDVEQLAAQAAPAFRKLIQRMGVSSAMAVPLRARGRTLGVVSMLRTRPGAPYTADDQRLVQDLADRAGLAIDNAVLVATLEHRVAERTTALEVANRELEAFSYSVSHDLRTPLRAIDGFSLALLEDYHDRLDDTGRSYLVRIRAGARRMAALIEDLLALARVSRETLHAVPLDLSQLAGEVVGEIRRRDPARATPIHIAPGMAAFADPRLLKIVLENLLGNAWKYTARHPRAEIWLGSDGGAFHVRDTGAGFDMANVGKLFQPFHRLHGERDYEGTGIGLAIVERIISHHGGRIWASGEVDRGATFSFTLGHARAA
ncbi:MAG TPA: PAS domain S-box protein [Kofleriaceae bacterium]|nr:PAS domain S-box protein [Kofleriaceae bacterium]